MKKQDYHASITVDATAPEALTALQNGGQTIWTEVRKN